MIRTRTIWTLLGASAILLAPACSSDSKASPPSKTTIASSDQSATEGVQAAAAVRSFLLAFNERDGDGLIDLLTDDACTNAFGEGCEELRAHAEDIFADQPAIDIRTMAEPVVTDATAEIDVTTRIQSGLHPSHFSLVAEEGTWLVNDFQIDGDRQVEPPKGMPAVDATLNEYAFELDSDQLESGYFALRLQNDGEEAHELSIKRVDVEADLQTALDPDAEQPPANTHFIPVAGSAIVAPGESTTLVLAESLPPGHYFVFCELTDASDTSHLAHGMATEFTVGG